MEISPALRRIFAWEVFYSTSYDTGGETACVEDRTLFPLFVKPDGEDRAVLRIDSDFFPFLVPGEEIHEFQTESRCCRNIGMQKAPTIGEQDGF
jgi:hypothetical protein